MSTNFYWKFEQPDPIKLINGYIIDPYINDMNPHIHICKRVWKGMDNGCIINWAQEPAVVRALCEKHPEEKIIKDEYETLYTGSEFMYEVNKHTDWQTYMIGQEFC